MVILYPTETVYGLGVAALDSEALATLYALKGREEGKPVSWLVRNVSDIEAFAVLSPLARLFAEQCLPGPLTLVLPVKDYVATTVVSSDRTVGFRISSDLYAQALIEAYMAETSMPLTCTSANVSGLPTQATVASITEQFRQHQPTFAGFDRVIDGGAREARASTVVRVIDDHFEILREGLITRESLLTLANNL